MFHDLVSNYKFQYLTKYACQTDRSVIINLIFSSVFVNWGYISTFPYIWNVLLFQKSIKKHCKWVRNSMPDFINHSQMYQIGTFRFINVQSIQTCKYVFFRYNYWSAFLKTCSISNWLKLSSVSLQKTLLKKLHKESALDLAEVQITYSFSSFSF